MTSFLEGRGLWRGSVSHVLFSSRNVTLAPFDVLPLLFRDDFSGLLLFSA